MAKRVPPAPADSGAASASESAISGHSPADGSHAATALRGIDQSRSQRQDTQRYASVLLPSAGVFIFGVALPLFTLCFEMATRLCAANWFNPLPTWWHVVLVALVPLSNLVVFGTRFSSGKRFRPWIAHLNAVALGVSFAYFFAFLPYILISCVGVVLYGMGLMPLAPILALPATISARRCLPHWGRILGEEPASLPRAWPIAVAVLAILALPVGRTALTHHEMEVAAGSDEAARNRALSVLRLFGSESAMIEACYPVAGYVPFRTQEWRGPASLEKSREIFYRVTGTAFNTFPAPRDLESGFMRLRGWNVDSALGGERVANKAAGLTLETSRLDAKVDATGLTAYTEWIMVFKNVTREAVEARAQIELPPDGVVSRLSLWINGEPREAAFGGRSQVRAAYQEVAVVQRRDPVLVTTCGPDRVLMQCFPVPANGGEMKIRVGITAPLRLISATSATLPWPRLLETNFENGGELRHTLWVDANARLADGSKSFRAEWPDSRFGMAEPLAVPIAEGTDHVISEDPSSPEFVIVQTVRKTATERLRHLSIVIDGSREMGAHAESLRRSLAALKPANMSVLFAGDELERWDGTGSLDLWLEGRKFRGGRDNLPALEAAWDRATGEPGGALLWIAGPQPVLLGSTEALRQRIERTRERPSLHLASVGRGPNRLLEDLDGLVQWQRLANYSDLERNVGAFLQQALAGGERFAVQRARVPRSEAGFGPAVDKHVARLWGREEIERLRATPAKLDEAVKLALQLQLVTPVSGAVVLERQEQYDRHGLKPAEGDSVPVIPEPGAALLLAAGAAWVGVRRRRNNWNDSLRATPT